MFTSMVPALTPISRDHNKKLVKIIQNLLSYEQSNIFRKPIPHKALGWDDYKDIVKKPIDLNYVRRQYNEGKYKFVEQFLDEIQMIWDNVFTYGKKEHETFDLAIKMQKYFDELLNDFLPQYHEKINRVLYFKQFEQKKPEKKSIQLSNQEKNIKKMQKMEPQNVKEEVKAQIVPEISVGKKKQLPNLRKTQSTTQITTPLGNTRQYNNQEQKKGNQTQIKFAQSIKANNNPVSNIIPESVVGQGAFRESSQQAQLKKESKQGRSERGNIKNDQKITPIFQPQQPSIIQLNKSPRNAPIPSQPQPLSQVRVQSSLQASKVQAPEQIQNQDSQQNHFPPMLVTLNKKPLLQQVNQLTRVMNLLVQIQQFQTLSKIVRILTKYEKENMLIDGQEVNFRMNEIHISTYSRIRKELDGKLNQLIQNDKANKIYELIDKHNINAFMDIQIFDSSNGIHVQQQHQEQQINVAQEAENIQRQHSSIC